MYPCVHKGELTPGLCVIAAELMSVYRQTAITLSAKVAAAIEALQEAQRETERMYILSEPAKIRVLGADVKED